MGMSVIMIQYVNEHLQKLPKKLIFVNRMVFPQGLDKYTRLVTI